MNLVELDRRNIAEDLFKTMPYAIGGILTPFINNGMMKFGTPATDTIQVPIIGSGIFPLFFGIVIVASSPRSVKTSHGWTEHHPMKVLGNALIASSIVGIGFNLGAKF